MKRERDLNSKDRKRKRGERRVKEIKKREGLRGKEGESEKCKKREGWRGKRERERVGERKRG
jgi:hypothetical protein